MVDTRRGRAARPGAVNRDAVRRPAARISYDLSAMRTCSALVALALLAACSTAPETTAEPDSKYSALIVDGQNNHRIWPTTSQLLKGLPRRDRDVHGRH